MSHPESVLVIDDDAAVTTTFARMLQLDGYAVRTVNDATRALDEAVRQRPDAILLDLRMPIVDGLKFLRQLRQLEQGGQRTPVAIVTGDYLLEDAIIEEAEALGATVKFKPLWLEDLMQLTQELLRAGSAPATNGVAQLARAVRVLRVGAQRSVS